MIDTPCDLPQLPCPRLFLRLGVGGLGAYETRKSVAVTGADQGRIDGRLSRSSGVAVSARHSAAIIEFMTTVPRHSGPF